MSHFLTRLATRAVTGTVTARPILPSVFESGAREANDPDTVLAQPGSSAPNWPVIALTAPGLPGDPSQRTAGGRSSHADPRAGVSPGSAQLSSRGGADRRTSDFAAVANSDIVPTATRPASERAISAFTHEPAALPISAVQPVAAARDQLPQPVQALSANGDRVTGTPSEPQVTVHIGRLEVRAIVAEPLREPARASRSPEPDPLSLSDYLRGRRVAQ